MIDISVAGLIDAAGRHPVLQGAAVVAGTFILEDAATVLSAMQVQTDGMALGVALTSLYIGIILGDIGLYGLGRLAALVPWAARLIPPAKQEHGRRWLEKNVFKVVFISRFIPGARLPTYTSCGFLAANFGRFTLAAVIATLIWTSLLFGVSLRVGTMLIDHLGAWRWVGMGAFALGIVVIGRMAVRLQGAAK